MAVWNINLIFVDALQENKFENNFKAYRQYSDRNLRKDSF